MPSVTVITSPREKLSKCTLRFLRDRPDITFFKATENFRFDATGFTLLAVDAPPIGPKDADRPILLLDSTWRLLPSLFNCLEGAPVERSIPDGVRTAYPRKSKLFDDPDAGLASVEALFLAQLVVGNPDLSLLEGYHWRDEFLVNVREAGFELPEG